MNLSLTTAAILSFVPALSLIINVRFNHNGNVKDLKRHQRNDLKSYAVDLIGVLWKYADLQVRYFTERLIIQEKIDQDEPIDDAHSAFVYQMKSELSQMEIELRRKIWNSQIEISKYDFPKLRNRVAKTFLTISKQVSTFELENKDQLMEIKIKILENALREEIKDLTKDFGRQTDILSLEIKNTNLFNDFTRIINRIRSFDFTFSSKNSKQYEGAAKQVFGETSEIDLTKK
ncbi:hypothetical protein [Lactococcus sp.]|uniref:hypothetical protein n=1 Tax=Lactococcus sp. TaxID=44273 RepID=UPI0035B05EE6